MPETLRQGLERLRDELNQLERDYTGVRDDYTAGRLSTIDFVNSHLKVILALPAPDAEAVAEECVSVCTKIYDDPTSWRDDAVAAIAAILRKHFPQAGEEPNK